MRKVSLFGYPFIADTNLEEISGEIIKQSSTKRQLVFTPNAYILQLFSRSEYIPLKEYTQKADFILPDGIPIVWLSKLKYKNNFIQQRITGSDLFPVLWSKIKEKGLKATFIVANQSIADAFLSDYPGNCNIIVPDFFSENDTDYINQVAAQTINKIEQIDSAFLFIGISDPKQTLLSKNIENKLAGSGSNLTFTTSLLGASFEFYFGTTKRAPRWMQKSGLEWLYRFAKEPQRLWKRYTIDNLKFLLLALKEF